MRDSPRGNQGRRLSRIAACRHPNPRPVAPRVPGEAVRDVRHLGVPAILRRSDPRERVVARRVRRRAASVKVRIVAGTNATALVRARRRILVRVSGADQPAHQAPRVLSVEVLIGATDARAPSPRQRPEPRSTTHGEPDLGPRPRGDHRPTSTDATRSLHADPVKTLAPVHDRSDDPILDVVWTNEMVARVGHRVATTSAAVLAPVRDRCHVPGPTRGTGARTLARRSERRAR